MSLSQRTEGPPRPTSFPAMFRTREENKNECVLWVAIKQRVRNISDREELTLIIDGVNYTASLVCQVTDGLIVQLYQSISKWNLKCGSKLKK